MDAVDATSAVRAFGECTNCFIHDQSELSCSGTDANSARMLNSNKLSTSLSQIIPSRTELCSQELAVPDLYQVL